jgi:fermentation-respiration switch protein FrsA (DUF1100 family)
VKWIGYLTWWAGAVPLLTLWGLHLRGQRRSRACWWLVGGFAVSWPVDGISLLLQRQVPAIAWMLSHVYPVGQGGAMYEALTRRRHQFWWLLGATAAAAWWSLWFGDVHRPGILAWAFMAAMIVLLPWRRRPQEFGLAGWALLVYFGMGLLFRAWYPVVMGPTPTLAAWIVALGYQACRLAGLTLMTAALFRPPPVLQPA